MVAGRHVIASLLVVVVVVVDDYTYYWVNLRPSISSYYKVRQVLLQSVTAYFITKCDSLFYYKVQ